MKLEIKDNNYVITIPISSTPKETAKMLLTASSGGWQVCGAAKDGTPLKANIMVGFNK